MRSSLLALVSALVLATGCEEPRRPAPAATTPAPSAAPTSAPSATPTPSAAPSAPTDTFPTSLGDLEVTPIHHGTVRLRIAGTVIWVDPFSQGDLSGPKADYVFITDIHSDHYDPKGLDQVKKDGTTIVAPPVVAEKVPGATVMKNGDTKAFGGWNVFAVPMYNLKRGPEAGKFYHDKGRGNGYVFAFGDKRVYVSGDTECTDEMRSLKAIDVAFVCMNLPYTMPPAEAAECIKAFNPRVLIPYHYRGSNLDELTKALEGTPGIEIRKRAFY